MSKLCFLGTIERLLRESDQPSASRRVTSMMVDLAIGDATCTHRRPTWRPLPCGRSYAQPVCSHAWSGLLRPDPSVKVLQSAIEHNPTSGSRSHMYNRAFHIRFGGCFQHYTLRAYLSSGALQQYLLGKNNKKLG